MKRSLLRAALIFIPLLIPVFLIGCESFSLREGQRLYKDGKYEEALKIYDEALVRNPDSELLNYHMGTALYKKKDYQKAIDHFIRVLTTEDPDLEARVTYNIGNCKYRQGETFETIDLARAAGLYQEALLSYKKATVLNEGDEDAKYNLGFVEKKLKEAFSKLEKQKDKEKRQEEPQPRKDSFSSSGPSAKRESEHTSHPLYGKTEGTRRKEFIRPRESRPIEGEKGEMSREEAVGLLEEYRREEESKAEPRDRKSRGYDPEIRKDW